MWNNVYITGGEYKDGGIVTNGEVNFRDKNTNSLKQLNKYFDDISKVMIEKRKKEKAEGKMDKSSNTDSTTIKNNPHTKHGK